MDITQLILHDHDEQRRLFAILDEIDRRDADRLSAVWSRLAAFLETHAAAEEAIFYPALLAHGTSAKDETKDAIHDHNEIRDAVRAAGRCAAGGDDWHAAVARAREANSDHMGEEERGALADFRRHAPVGLRHDLAVAFAVFEARHADGVQEPDKDPARYVARHD